MFSPYYLVNKRVLLSSNYVVVVPTTTTIIYYFRQTALVWAFVSDCCFSLYKHQQNVFFSSKKNSFEEQNNNYWSFGPTHLPNQWKWLDIVCFFLSAFRNIFLMSCHACITHKYEKSLIYVFLMGHTYIPTSIPIIEHTYSDDYIHRCIPT